MFKVLKEQFKKPSKESYPWVIWIWNGNVSKKELIKQLEWVGGSNFGGVIIRPGRDMFPEYLSEEFLELCGIVLSYGKQYGFSVRFGEDFFINPASVFQQEFSKTRVLRAQQLRLIENRILNESEEFVFEKYSQESDLILTYEIKNSLIDPNSVKELNSFTSADNGFIKWQAPQSGCYGIMVLRKEFMINHEGFYIPNFFSPKTASIYLQTVFTKYKECFSKYIPSVFEGFFIELPFKLCPSNNGIPWDDDFVVKFRSKTKKNIIKILPALYCENFPSAPKNREQIYSFIKDSIYERFVSQLEGWVNKNRLSNWIMVPEKNFTESCALMEGYVPSLPELRCVGLQNIEGSIKNYILLHSIADANKNEFHRDTVIVIGRNNKGIGATLASLKKEVDVSFLAGKGRIIIDGFYFNPEFHLDLKTPFNISYFSPESKEAKRLSLYIGRLQQISKNIHFNRQIAVLNPTLELMSFYVPTEDGAATYSQLYDKFEKMIFSLERNGISYDLVNPSFLLNCTIRNNGEFGIIGEKTKKNSYVALIVPYFPEISRDALAFIEKLVQKQGKVIFINEPPKGTIEDGISLNMSSRMEKIMSKRYGGTTIVKMEELDEFLKTFSSPVSVTVNGSRKSEIFHAYGYGENYEFYLFHNFSDKEEIATIELPQNRHFTFMDCENGEMIEISPLERKAETCIFKVTMQGGATVILIGSSVQIASTQTISSAVNISVNPFLIPDRNYRIVLKDLWLFYPCSFNALPLSVWNKRIGLSRESGLFSHYYESIFQINELPTIASLFFSSYGIRRAIIHKKELPIEITINGVKIEPTNISSKVGLENITNEKKMDDSIMSNMANTGLLCNIREHLLQGMNRVAIRTKGDFLEPETFAYPPIIFGDFRLTKGKTGWVVDKIEEIENRLSWTQFGFPYMCGKGRYNQSFEVPNEYNRLILRLPFVSGTVNIFINQKEVGTFCFQPIEIDITSFCENKRNDIDIFIVNSVDTLLRMNGRQSGIIGDVYLDIY